MTTPNDTPTPEDLAVEFWRLVNDYAETCGGDTSTDTSHKVSRQLAVKAICSYMSDRQRELAEAKAQLAWMRDNTIVNLGEECSMQQAHAEEMVKERDAARAEAAKFQNDLSLELPRSNWTT